MKTRSTICSRCWRPAGLTLIEVLAAIVILGTTLVGIVLSKADLYRQAAQTGQQNVAVRAADDLITGWWKAGGIPIDQSGPVAGAPSLTWQTRIVSNEAIQKLGARVVRVEIHAANETIVGVELVLPLPDPKAQAQTRPADAITGATPGVGAKFGSGAGDLQGGQP